MDRQFFAMEWQSKGWRWLGWLVLAPVLLACGVNPVTGERELTLVSQQEEVALGQRNYGPSQQSQGGLLTIDPELTAYVNEVGQRVAARSPRDLPYEFVVLNNSVPNAWALPGGKIAVNRGLLYELQNEAELAAVLGHEAVHAAARHGAQSMERGMLLQGAMVATAIAAQNSDYAGFIVGGAQVGAQLISQRYGRDAERESDLYGTRYLAEAGYDPAAAVSLQETFVRLSEGQEQGWLNGLFASHPPSIERVRNNQELVAQLRSEGFTGGELGTERYQQRTAFLRENKVAYDAFDEALALAGQDNFSAAREQLDTAIAQLPQEARFYGLKADIALAEENYDEAIALYNQALARDDGYFNYYLGRGLAFSRQGNRARAQSDLQASVDLLPTAIAMNELGTLSLASNDRNSAKAYFQQAAGAPGALGEQATSAFIQLDIADNPANYVQTQMGAASDGRVIVRILNRAPVALTQATLEVQAILNGQPVSRTLSVQGLASGQSRDLDTGLRLPSGAVLTANNARVMVTAASVN